MTVKPSYLGLLNAIAQGEARAHRYLSAWAERTPDPDVKRVLQTVAIREGEHGFAFEKRLCELGFAVLERPDPDFARRLEVACSDRSDLEKFEALGYGRGERAADDPFARVFEDRTLDVRTGELLGRYIAEERDSARLLQGCYQTLRARAGSERGAAHAEPSLGEICAALAKLGDAVADLERRVADLAEKTGRR